MTIEQRYSILFGLQNQMTVERNIDSETGMLNHYM